ncbi:MAG: hypothetical protein LBE76_03065 [Nitrososphaerota archaeon]|jgi:hypothetical protein|nr:hypothetical protein [Nitrososphaerota archaeon]
MSDLANSCEYLTVDKSCVVFSDNSKARANRQLNCKNNQKNACCYLCVFRLQCAICCKYLGQSENCVAPKSVIEADGDDVCVVDTGLASGSLQLEHVPVVFCFSCNVAMAWAKTQFIVDNWCGNTFPLISGKTLPVTVLLCPKCGKIEFKSAFVCKEEM